MGILPGEVNKAIQETAQLTQETEKE